MATKKQKRLQMQAKHEAFMDEYHRSGLEAQRKDRIRREAIKARKAEEEIKAKSSAGQKSLAQTLNVIFSSPRAGEGTPTLATTGKKDM